jgi:hypothetical protein
MMHVVTIPVPRFCCGRVGSWSEVVCTLDPGCARDLLRGRDPLRQLRPCGHQAQLTWNGDRERGETSAQVLDQGMPTSNDVS